MKKPQAIANVNSDFEAQLRQYDISLQERYRVLFAKYLKGKTKAHEFKELERAGFVAQRGNDDWIDGGLRGVSEWIAAEFNIRVTKATVGNWINGTKLPKGCYERYPAAASGHHHKSFGRPWVEKYLVPNRREIKQIDSERSPDQRIKAAKARMAEIEADEMERKRSKDWMLTASHEFTMASVGTVARNTTLNAIEKRLTSLIEAVLVEFVADDSKRDKLLDQIRTICAATMDDWQMDVCRRMEDLDRECRLSSDEGKNRYK